VSIHRQWYRSMSRRRRYRPVKNWRLGYGSVEAGERIPKERETNLAMCNKWQELLLDQQRKTHQDRYELQYMVRLK